MANASSSSDVGFLLTRAKDYQVSGISGEALAAAMVMRTPSTTRSVANGGSMRNLNAPFRLRLRNGGGQRGRLNNSSTATTVGTLLQAADIVGFEVQMKVDLSVDDRLQQCAPLPCSRWWPLTVVAVDRTAGTVTSTPTSAL